MIRNGTSQTGGGGSGRITEPTVARNGTSISSGSGSTEFSDKNNFVTAVTDPRISVVRLTMHINRMPKAWIEYDLEQIDGLIELLQEKRQEIAE